MKRFLAGLLSLMVWGCTASARELSPARGTNLMRVAAWDEANRRLQPDGQRWLARRGLVADRQARTVTLLAESCGIEANATVEFGIVGETSDRTYEALFLGYARAIDIGDALEHIGLPRGKNVSGKAQRYWPTGERVTIQVDEMDAPHAAPRHLEDYIFDRKTGATLARAGFTYCGSPRVPNPDGGGEVCLADLEAPVSLLSLYNEPQTVLDVPRQAAQGDVYENYTANPATRLPASRMVRLILSPEPRPSGKPRMRPMALTVAPAEHADGLRFTLVEPEGEAIRIHAFAELLKHMMSVIDDGFDPLVTLRLEDALPLSRAREVCKVIQRIEGENGLRMEPPPDGALYYKAFLPDDSWRERAKRLSQPWELHVGRADPPHAPSLLLIKTKEDWSDPNAMDPKLTPVEYPVASFADIPQTIEQAGRGLPVLLVYAPDDAPLGLFMPGVRGLRETHPTVYVFSEP